MKDSLGREPRWNADRCAPGAPGAAVPVRHGRRALRLSAVRLRFFLSFFPFVIAGPDPAIHAEVTLEKRFPPSVCLRHVSMDHRHRRPQDAVLRTAMSGGDDL